MAVAKVIGKKGNGIDRPRPGDFVTMQYVGYLYDASKVSQGYRGKLFESSNRHEWLFTTKIGVGHVIRGWDEGIIDTDGGMTLGEIATFTITSDYAYGEVGYPAYVPPFSNLIFDVQLIAINGKMAPPRFLTERAIVGTELCI